MKLIDFAIPDIPESLEITVKREQYLAKQALADTQTAKLVRVLLYFPLITKNHKIYVVLVPNTPIRIFVFTVMDIVTYQRVVANEMPLAPINPYRISENYAASFGLKIKILTL